MPRSFQVPTVEDTHCANTRLYAVVLLSLIGLRPAEVVGLRWMDVDLEQGTVRVEVTRTLVAGKVIEKDTKSVAGDRWLPLPLVVLQALKALHTRQLRERLKAGEAYEASGRVVVNDLGKDWKTDKLRREAYKLMASAGVRKTRLYDARHACLSWMANNGVPDTVVSAWAGHRPVLHEAQLRPPRPAVAHGGVRETDGTARLTCNRSTTDGDA
ncbi:site-specific integrase [Streptomyces sp. NPDC102462]|uniref:site-specific integrase n=1 Tax=Streptomyces sp. NPDC102462 TaxID=3366178 RepID=UPI0037FCDFA3